jgi:hypothetical protein
VQEIPSAECRQIPPDPGIVPTGRAGRKPRTSRNRFDTEPEIKSFGDKKLTNRLQAAKAVIDNKICSHETGSSDPAGSDFDTTVVTLADKASVRNLTVPGPKHA